MDVAVKWKQVGAQLNFDPSGNYLNIIEADRGKEGVESCCQTMFQHWLKGYGEQPATWGKLLEILRDCDFRVLASDLEKALKSRKVSAFKGYLVSWEALLLKVQTRKCMLSGL